MYHKSDDLTEVWYYKFHRQAWLSMHFVDVFYWVEQLFAAANAMEEVLAGVRSRLVSR